MTPAVHLLVTGYARSGLTLVNRLLDAHPQCSVADRTQLDFLTSAMRACNAVRDRPPSGEPFGSLFDESGCALDAVTQFFRTQRWTRGGPEMDLADVLRAASEEHARSTGKPEAVVCGLREHFCEVLAPYLLERAFKVILVVRDPLDLVASARLGDRGAKANKGWALNPRVRVLDMVRQWRKSVALAVLTAGHPRARLIRYERLVSRPSVWLALCRWLGLEVIPPERLLGGDSGWSGNSSFGQLNGLSREPVGRGVLLPPSVAAFVRGATAPERRLLGYERGHPELIPYKEDCEIDPAYAPDLRVAERESQCEWTRRQRLASERLAREEACRWFLHPDVYRRLHGAWHRMAGRGATGRM